MISLLRGEVLHIAGSCITLDVSGVGYEVFCTAPLLSSVETGGEASIVIYTDVREDSIQLFGFQDRLEKQVFSMLTAVKGVGSKSASEILSRIEKKQLLRIIGVGDLQALQRVKGIGRKTAERIVVELKDRVAQFVEESGQEIERLSGGIEVSVHGVPGEAIEALCALGFSRQEAEMAVSQVDIADSKLNASALVKEALRYV